VICGVSERVGKWSGGVCYLVWWTDAVEGGVDEVKGAVVVSQGRREQAATGRRAAEIELGGACKCMADIVPFHPSLWSVARNSYLAQSHLQIFRVVDWDPGEELKRARRQEEVFAHPDDGRIRVEPRNDWINQSIGCAHEETGKREGCLSKHCGYSARLTTTAARILVTPTLGHISRQFEERGYGGFYSILCFVSLLVHSNAPGSRDVASVRFVIDPSPAKVRRKCNREPRK
jgi:hypothetical protein